MRATSTWVFGALICGFVMAACNSVDVDNERLIAERLATEAARDAMMDMWLSPIDPDCEAPVAIWIEKTAAEAQRDVLNDAMLHGSSYELVTAASLAASRIAAAHATAQYECNE